MGLYTSPFVLLGLENSWNANNSFNAGLTIPGSASSGLNMALDSYLDSQNIAFGDVAVIVMARGELWIADNGGRVNLSFVMDTGAEFYYPLTVSGGLVVPSGESITGAGSLNLTGTGEFGGLFLANGGIETAGGGTAPAAFTPGATGVATAVSTSKNVVLICTAAGTQTGNGAVNGTSIGAQWTAGMSFYLKANDTITWTGSAAPTFLTMAA